MSGSSPAGQGQVGVSANTFPSFSRQRGGGVSMLGVGYLLNGRYQIEGVLGRGGMGDVYLALDSTLGGKKVAVKEMAVNINHAELRAMAIDQFKKEATLLARLEHTSLVDVTDYFEVGGSAYLVMAYVEGRTLEEIMRNAQGFLPLQTVLDWADQICEVLEYLHQRAEPILFRDLKPANIMLDARGRIRLIDFGIARVLDPESKTSTFLKGAGTAEFAPIEQFGGSTTDARSDVYSLGATLFNLLTGQLPPTSVNLMSGEAKWPSLTGINAAIPTDLEAVVRRAMGLRKEERYQSVADLHADLRALKHPHQTAVMVPAASPSLGTPTVLPIKEPPPPTPPPSRSSHWRVAAVMLLLLPAWVFLGPHWKMAGVSAGATLIVASDPDQATIKMDGAACGHTPLSLKLASGRHELLLDKNGRTPVRVNVVVPEDSSAAPRVESTDADVKSSVNQGVCSVQVKLRQQHGVMTLQVQPATVEVLVDGQPRGRLSSGQSLTLNSGAHAVTLRAAGYRPLTRKVEVGDNQIVSLTAKLEATMTTLLVQSKPSGATVLLDGLEQPGVTPLTLSVSAALHQITVQRDGFAPFSKPVVTSVGKKSVLLAQLQREAAVVVSPPQGQPPDASSPPPTTQARLQDATMYERVDPQTGVATGIVTSYRGNDTFYCSMKVHDLKVGTEITAVWEGPDDLSHTDKIVSDKSGNLSVFFKLSPMNRPWSSGRYTVRLLADGVQQGSLNFEVR